MTDTLLNRINTMLGKDTWHPDVRDALREAAERIEKLEDELGKTQRVLKIIQDPSRYE